MSAATGSACAFFLWALDTVTRLRFDHPQLLYALPLAGGLTGWLYLRWGSSSEGGNNLILERIHEPGGGVPRRMAPLILISTLIAHLCGGSVGREGTAVQMGGSIAGGCARWWKLGHAETRTLLMAGVAAGFGAVFGTPLAGAIFAIEVVTVGRLHHAQWLPCLLASLVGDWVCRSWGAHHSHYRIDFLADTLSLGGLSVPGGWLAAQVVVLGAVAGMVGTLFCEMVHLFQAWLKKITTHPLLRPALAGALVVALAHLLGTKEYLGLGVWSPHAGDATIESLFRASPEHPWAWWWKTVFTTLALGGGFKGGEVTPLFYIGAGLGHSMSLIGSGPADLLAAIGFIALFAGASNTPLACAVMGMELFGAQHAISFGVACYAAYATGGHSGIYLSQQMARAKHPTASIQLGSTLREAREQHPTWITRFVGAIREARWWRR